MKQIKLSQGEFAIVDEKDFEFLSQWNWCAAYLKAKKKYHRIGNDKGRNTKAGEKVKKTP